MTLDVMSPPLEIPKVESENEAPLKLKALLHALKCGQRQARAETEFPQQGCNYPECKEMKDLMTHMLICFKGELCMTSFCFLSKCNLSHWMECTEQDCAFCSPIRQTNESTENSKDKEHGVNPLINTIDTVVKYAAMGIIDDIDIDSVDSPMRTTQRTEISARFNSSCVINTLQKYDLEMLLDLEVPSSGMDPFHKRQALTIVGCICYRRGTDTNSGDGARQAQQQMCSHELCNAMRIDFSHVETCDEKGKSCDMPHCPLTRQLLAHWKQCKDLVCPVCPFGCKKGVEGVEPLDFFCYLREVKASPPVNETNTVFGHNKHQLATWKATCSSFHSPYTQNQLCKMRQAPKISLPGNETLEAKQPLLIGASPDIQSKHWHSKVLLHARYCVLKEQCSYPVCQVCCPSWQTTITLKKCTQDQNTEAALPTSETDPQPGTSSENAAGASSSNVGDFIRRLTWVSLPKKRYNMHATMIPDKDFNEILAMRISINRDRIQGKKDYFVQILKVIQASALDTLRHFVASQCYTNEVIAEPFNPSCVLSTIKEYDLKDRILGVESILGMSLFQKQQALTLISYICHIRERNQSKSCIENKCTEHPTCTFMKIDFDHVVACRKGNWCVEPDCSPTHRLINHWENCFDKLCDNLCLSLTLYLESTCKMIEAPEIPVAHEPLPENETFQADQPLLKDLPQQSVSSIIESIEIKHWQLKVLLHAKHCDKQQKCFYNGDCKTMKDVLNHMKTCSDEDQSCKVDFCISSRDVLLHKKNCIDSDCPICPPPLQTTISLEQSATGQKTLPTSETGAAAAADPQPGTSSENAAGASSSSDVEDCGRMEPWVSLPDDRYDICVEMNTEVSFKFKFRT
ncbi:Hypothetical predicted protein [Cloeon dipterum]|uniref:histone acetyltransferase n=1 Tax=Cloeon dipterum TaxID=197152 RepID=A0A8S1D4G6_9INSE|nr:Hypothetical predicted protein [Cloeon dipterum]